MFKNFFYLYFPDTTCIMLIPVAAWCKEWDCSRSLDGTVVSNPAGDMDFSLF